MSRRLATTAFGARFVSQVTTRGRENRRPIDVALLSSGTVDIHDARAKSKNDSKKTASGAALAAVSSTGAIDCDLRKNREAIAGAQTQGLTDAHAPQKRAELPGCPRVEKPSNVGGKRTERPSRFG